SLSSIPLSDYRHLLDLHSFPTRRSSDLIVSTGRPGGIAARSGSRRAPHAQLAGDQRHRSVMPPDPALLSLNTATVRAQWKLDRIDRKSTRLNSSHDQISYAVFCLKKKIR